MSEATILPPNATPLERAFDGAAGRISRIDAGPVGTLWDPGRCPEPLLARLAWALGLDDWDDDWPEAAKRRALRLARRRHELRGTWAAVEAELDLMQAAYEWSESKTKPMTGRVTIFNGATVLADGADEIRERISRVRRAAFHLEVVLESGIEGTAFFQGGLAPVSVTRIAIV